MRVYRVTFHDEQRGCLLSWHPTKRAASKELTRLKLGRDEPSGPECVDPVDIPTNKAGLLAWLNANLNADNG